MDGSGRIGAEGGYAPPERRLGLGDRIRRWRNRRAADPRFQAWAARNLFTRGIARAQAARLYDLTAGFVYAQTLAACVELDVFEFLLPGPRSAAELAAPLALDADRAERLMAAACAVGLVEARPGGRWGLSTLGAAALGAPGVREMVRHHRLFYADLADPVALLRGEASPRLSRFWAYLEGGADVDPADAAAYSALMAASQTMVAEETLAAVDLRGRTRLLDVGGGEGAFAAAALQAAPGLEATVFDLPSVVARAPARFAAAGVSDRAKTAGGSFLTDDLPGGHDVVSLVRVCYDHPDETVHALLARCRAALAPGGLMLITEPMSGGRRPTRSGDAYFGFYMLAMESGRARSPERLAEMMASAGFTDIRRRPVHRPFITGVLTATVSATI
ncbi:MAG: methyltransferase [Pseudomonadota bacterium]